MNRRLAAVCALGLCAVSRLGAVPVEPPQRSVSSSGQFIVYCDDMRMRLAVASYTEETKSAVLRVLDLQQNPWKIPIVITLGQPDATEPGGQDSSVKMFDADGGTKIELNVTLGSDLAAVRFPQQFIRAVLLELEYRDKPQIKGGEIYIDPPAWLVEGLTALLQSKGRDPDVDIYKTLLDSEHLPSLKDFLVQNSSGMSATSLKLYQTYSVCLVQLLLDLSKGRASLAAYIHDLPTGKDGTAADLMRHFPPLGASEQSMEKWWSLGMARIAASDRYKGLSIQETEQRLAALLKITVPTGKNGEVKVFPVEDFPQFVKIPQARPVLANAASALMSLSTQASPLFRPVVAEYQQIFDDLQKRKNRHVAERLKAVAKYRELLLTRMDQIDDYLNWFEATQVVLRSNSFDDYMRTAKEISDEPPKREDAISQYLDSLEIEIK